MSDSGTAPLYEERLGACGDVGNAAAAVFARGLCFAYPRELAGGEGKPVLRNLDWELPAGAFALLVGDTGSGKTTLLRLLKPEIAPAGLIDGELRVFGKDVASLDAGASVTEVGFVFQSPDNQIVCDTVWHELAFGLENLGMDEAEMRLRVAETCQFLGMEPLFHRHCHELSGGQRQLVALASVLVMRPRLLLLDEPTSQLDPVAEKDFLSLLFRINRELGVTVVVATHRPRPMEAYVTHAFRLEGGRLSAWSGFREAGAPGHTLRTSAHVSTENSGQAALKLDDLWFRYTRDDDWVLRGCDLTLRRGEVRALMGGNGSGKSTLLALAAGVSKPKRGRATRPLASRQVLLPQASRALLGCETVEAELMEWSHAAGYGRSEVDVSLKKTGLADARGRHPYDLSQGQQLLLALEKLLLTQPLLLLLDEPTKGLDENMRQLVMERLAEAARSGATVLVATHDVAFVCELCPSVSLLFDGQLVLTQETERFFASSWVYGGEL